MTLFFIGLLVLLLCLSAFLSGSEISLFSLSSHTLKSFRVSQDSRLNLISHLMQKPRDILVTLLILNILSNILIQNTVSNLFSEVSSWALKVGVPLALTLIFGEILPKSVALPNNQKVAYKVAGTVAKASRFLGPIRRPLTTSTSWISRVMFFFLSKEEEISVEEMRHVLNTSKKTKVLLPQECELIHGTLDLQNAMVRELMRPREEIFFYSLQDPIEKLLSFFVQHEISRLPVCSQDLDTVLGILSLKQYFFSKEKIAKPQDLIAILKPVYYVPEGTRAWTVLGHLRQNQESMGVVVDEYGSVSGLITQEDLMETVVGDIRDKRETSLYTRASSDVLIASGKLELSEFERIFNVPMFSKEHVVTLGGWLIEQLEDIPTAGTKYKTDHFLFHILEAEPNRVKRIYVRKIGK